MFSGWLRYGSITAVALALSSVHAFGSRPAENPLLRLVPANAEIVAGIEDPHHGDQSERLLIVTHNDSVDLYDWIALAGVDDGQHVDKLIEAAASSQRGELSEHLLLARGWFNGRRILQRAQDNGGIGSHYHGVRVVELKPFARELHEMKDIRWLAIPNDGTVIFGSPTMVKSALDRYATSSVTDAELEKRVRELKPDVNCWSVLTMPGAMLVHHVRAGALDEMGSALLRRVSGITVGVHYGSKERVDFAFATDSPENATALAANIGGPSPLLRIADTVRTRSANISVEQNAVRGSVRVADKEFDAWLSTVYAELSGEGAHEEIAHMGTGH